MLSRPCHGFGLLDTPPSGAFPLLGKSWRHPWLCGICPLSCETMQMADFHKDITGSANQSWNASHNCVTPS
ncbi:hypothetical protein HOLleu_18468 [Holothuria leucospilota]|uniref:Uncharacterized protein n=1 Tax=Holothuria leucospilota TaxID=206669 RepID=A0A9Q1C452_HOLLE|nr:hypothetical protein HOLleu_18468 [Holothuria leucospilota]